MATSRDLNIGCDEYSNLKCSICAKRNKVANANYYCNDCQKHLCTYCLAYHDEFIENHNVVQGLGDDKDVITEKCGKHADELITLYCRKDDELLCRKRRLLEHGPVLATERRQRDSRVGGLVEEQSWLKAENRSRELIVTNINGGCHLGNGSLVIADGRNSRLELVDPSSGKVTITKYCDADERPIDICCIGPQEVAVALLGSTQAHVYNAVSLTRTRTIELGHNHCKIACHGSLLYCASYGWDCCIIFYVYDVSDGKKLREFRTNKIVCPSIEGIAVNGPGDRLYAVNPMGLQCVDTNGQQIFYLSEKDLGFSMHNVSGVTTDHDGHVFVCDSFSNSVVKVTEDGHVVGKIFLGKDWRKPEWLSYDVRRNQLCVGLGSDMVLLNSLVIFCESAL